MKRIVLFLLLFMCIGTFSLMNSNASEFTSSEMIELRTANSKTFQTDDGSGKMVLYNHDIHFYENGKYNDIDMSLVKDKNTYQTKNSNYQVSLPETLAKGNLIEVQHKDSSIKFYYPDIIESNPSISNSLGSKGIEKAQSQLTYSNIKINTDLVLDLSPAQLKESFVLSEYVKDFKIDYYLILNNLTMLTLDGSSFIFVNSQGEIIFEFEPYFMFDSKEVYSDDVIVTYEEVFKGFYRFQVKPNQEWLSCSERVFPVVIDPIVNFKMNTTNQFMRDEFCYEGTTSCTDNSYFRVQYDDLYFVEPLTETLVFSLIELNVENIYDNIMSIYNTSSYTSIDDIKLKLHIKDNFTPASGILVQDVSALDDDYPGDYDLMHGLSTYTYQNIKVLSGSGSFYEFNMDKEIYKYNILNKDLILRLYPTQPLVRYSTRFYASNYSSSTYQPSIEINLGDWFVSDTRTTVNCYGFAIREDLIINPGHFSTKQENLTLEQLYSNVIADLNFLGIGYRFLSGPNDNIGSNEVIIGMRLGINADHPSLKDYHFVVKHSNGRWVHKPSINPSELFCSSAYTPEDIVWSVIFDDNGKIKDQYDSATKYIAVTF